LAAAVRDARTGQTLADIHDKGGPSANVVSRLSRWQAGDPTWTIRPATLGELDIGIDGWRAGDASRLLERPAEPPGVVVGDVSELADKLVDALVARLRLRVELADAAQPA
jgi:hypothetical protein